MYKFFAYLNRMKYINRWSLMRNTFTENIMEHSQQVAVLAHALANISNLYFGGHLDANSIAVKALFHETSEVLTGDLPTPIKYFNPGIRDAYKAIERMASEKLLDYLPEDFQEDFRALLFPDEESCEWRIVKAADRISAYVKCLEEYGFGNREFLTAQENIRASVSRMNMPEAEDFMREFAPSFMLPLDALN